MSGGYGEAERTRYPFGQQRHASSYDGDALRRLTHQHLPVPPQIQRMTCDNLKALKSAAKSEQGLFTAVTRAICRFFSGIIAAICSLFSGPERKHSICQTYGHKVDSNWSGPYPTCTDCGTEIRSTDQIRSSRAR